MKSAAQKLCYCRFRNRHKNFAAVDLEIGTKATLLPIQKSIAKNFITADSEISTKTAVLSIQKLATNYAVVDF
jgi:hypothetical protein